MAARDELYEHLFLTQFPSMVRLALLLGADDPQDTAQEAFVRIHAAHHAGREPVNDLGHRLTQAMNAAADKAQIDVDAWQQNEERLSRRSPARRRLMASSTIGLAAAAVAVVIAVAAWPHDHGTAIPAGPTPPMASESPPATTPNSTQPSPGDTRSNAASSTGVRNEALTPAVRDALTDAYSAGTHTPRSDITGMRPGSAFYAFDPATGMHWAVAEFQFSGPVVAEQDGGSYGIFSEQSGGNWQLIGQGVLVPEASQAKADCRAKLATEVMQAWSWDISKPTCGSQE